MIRLVVPIAISFSKKTTEKAKEMNSGNCGAFVVAEFSKANRAGNANLMIKALAAACLLAILAMGSAGCATTGTNGEDSTDIPYRTESTKEGNGAGQRIFVVMWEVLKHMFSETYTKDKLGLYGENEDLKRFDYTTEFVEIFCTTVRLLVE